MTKSIFSKRNSIFFGNYFCSFCCFTSLVNSYDLREMVSSPNNTFFLGKLEQAVNQYFMHILLLVTDNNPSWMIQRKGFFFLNYNLRPLKLYNGTFYPMCVWSFMCSYPVEAITYFHTLTLVMLNIFMYYTPPHFYPVNFQHFSC